MPSEFENEMIRFFRVNLLKLAIDVVEMCEAHGPEAALVPAAAIIAVCSSLAIEMAIKGGMPEDEFIEAIREEYKRIQTKRAA